MRILIVDPGFTYSTLAIAQSYTDCFERLGYEVAEYDMLRALIIARNGLKHITKKLDLNELTELACSPILNWVMAERIDFVLVIHGANMNPSIVLNIRNTGAKIGLILTDDPMQVDFSIRYSKFYDYVFSNEKNTISFHGDKCYYLPVAVNEKIFCPKYVPSQYISNIFYGGSFYKERMAFIEDNENLKSLLLKYNTIFAGTKKIDFKDDRLNSLFVQNRLSYEEMSKYTAGADISIDYPRDEFARNVFGEVNKDHKIKATCLSPKVFEAAASRSLIMTSDYREEIEELFPKGLIPTYKNADDLCQNIETYMNDEKKREDITKEIYEYCLANHTYMNRTKEIEKIIGISPSKNIYRSRNILNNNIMNKWESEWKQNFEQMKSKGIYHRGKSVQELKSAYKNSERLIIVSNGPSLESQYQNHFKNNCVVMALNEAFKLLIYNGILADYTVVIHPHKEVFDRCFKGVHLKNDLICSTLCSYNVVEDWINKGKDVYFFNSSNEHPVKKEVAEYTKFPDIPTGYAVGFSALSLGIYMGFKNIDIIGLDLCYLDNKKYAGVPLRTEDTNKKEILLVENSKGKLVMTDKVMMKVRSACLNMIESNPDVQFNVYGGGMLFNDRLCNLKQGSD